jgi:hypothetical protein
VVAPDIAYEIKAPALAVELLIAACGKTRADVPVVTVTAGPTVVRSV